MNNQQKNLKKSEIIGLIPAAGDASRISPLPCSKEIYPVGYRYHNTGSEPVPKAISAYLLESMDLAGIENIFMVIQKGKWDIPEYYGNGSRYNINLAYVVTKATPGTPFTVDLANPFVKDKHVLFGFPDIRFEPLNAFVRIIEKQKKSGADIVLGIFPADNPSKMDMVEVDENNRVRNIVIKPEKTSLKFTWILAFWTPVFTNFLHSEVEVLKKNMHFENNEEITGGGKEIYMGYIIQKAIDSGIKVVAATFKDGFYIDIGTVDDLKKAIQMDMT